MRRSDGYTSNKTPRMAPISWTRRAWLIAALVAILSVAAHGQEALDDTASIVTASVASNTAQDEDVAHAIVGYGAQQTCSLGAYPDTLFIIDTNNVNATGVIVAQLNGTGVTGSALQLAVTDETTVDTAIWRSAGILCDRAYVYVAASTPDGLAGAVYRLTFNGIALAISAVLTTGVDDPMGQIVLVPSPVRDVTIAVIVTTNRASVLHFVDTHSATVNGTMVLETTSFSADSVVTLCVDPTGTYMSIVRDPAAPTTTSSSARGRPRRSSPSASPPTPTSMA